MLSRIIILLNLLVIGLGSVSCSVQKHIDPFPKAIGGGIGSLSSMPLPYFPQPTHRENYAHLETNPTKKVS